MNEKEIKETKAIKVLFQKLLNDSYKQKDEIIKEEGKKKNYKATRPLEIEEYEEIIINCIF